MALQSPAIFNDSRPTKKNYIIVSLSGINKAGTFVFLSRNLSFYLLKVPQNVLFAGQVDS